MTTNDFDDNATIKKDDVIKNIKGVVLYLTEHNWKIPRSTIHRHILDGKLKRSKDGCFSITDVERYARKNLKRLTLSNKSFQPGDLLNNIEGVISYISGQGCHVPRSTLYNHIGTKLKRNEDGSFFVVNVEKYIRKFLKPIDPEKKISQGKALNIMKKFYRDKAEEMINFVDGDLSRLEAFRLFLLNETENYFKSISQNTGE